MLTFKKHSYTKAQLSVLYDALSAAQLSMCKSVDCNICCDCPNYRPCKDLACVLEYISTLIPERWASKR